MRIKDLRDILSNSTIDDEAPVRVGSRGRAPEEYFNVGGVYYIAESRVPSFVDDDDTDIVGLYIYEG